MSFVAFLIAASVLAVTPGPGITYVVARTVAGGRAEGLSSCLGTAPGGMLHVLASAVGLSLVLAQSAVAFSVVKYVGAAYLVFLGVRMLWRHQQDANLVTVSPQGTRRALWEGIAVEALNVKTALFFLAFLPQFVNPAEPLVAQLVLLGSICVALNTLADVGAVLAAHKLLGMESVRSARSRLMHRVCGLTMIGLGIFLATARRQG